MSSRRYQLIEALPYPRATRTGRLTDPNGIPLHGVYERKVPGGFRAGLVNNGTVVHRYDYPSSLADTQSERTRSFSNLVHTLGPWLVPNNAERPVTNYPASEFPLSSWRSLWNQPIILDSLLHGTKRVGLLAGSPTETERWASEARQHGLVVRQVPAWTVGSGDPWRLVLIARSGPLAGDEDLELLRAEYDAQSPAYQTGPALDRLSTMLGEELRWPSLVSPATADDLLISGYCFGYPVASTAACITGTHG